MGNNLFFYTEIMFKVGHQGTLRASQDFTPAPFFSGFNPYINKLRANHLAALPENQVNVDLTN